MARATDNRRKLTPEQVQAIRRRYSAGGVTQRSLAEEYGVSRDAIANVVRGRSWRVERYGGPTLTRQLGAATRKLSPEQVQAIRDAYAAGGVTQAQLAARYGVARSTVAGLLSDTGSF